jgi:hypothetical protein
MKLSRKRTASVKGSLGDYVATDDLVRFGTVIARRSIPRTLVVGFCRAPKQELPGKIDLGNLLESNAVQLVFKAKLREPINDFYYKAIYCFAIYTFGATPEHIGEIEVRAFKRNDETAKFKPHWRINRVTLMDQILYQAAGT